MGQWRVVGIPSSVRHHAGRCRRIVHCRAGRTDSSTGLGEGMTRPLFGLLAVAIAFTVPSTKAMAQQETAAGYDVEKDIALLRRNLRTEKKKLIAANVPLTETEATKFWPVYDQYTADMSKQYDKFYA